MPRPAGRGYPGVSRAGGSRSHVEQRHARYGRPAASRRARPSGRCRRTGRRARPSRRAPVGAASPGGAPTTPAAARSGTRSPGANPQNATRSVGPGQPGDRVGRRHAPELGDVVEVLAVVHGRDLDQRALDGVGGRRRRPARDRAGACAAGSARPSSSTVRAPGTISTAARSPASRRRPQLGAPGLDLRGVGDTRCSSAATHPPDGSSITASSCRISSGEAASLLAQ